MSLESHKQNSTNISPTDVKPVVCFSCRELGHKSPQCSKNSNDKMKRLLIPEDKIEQLATNDVMAIIVNTRIPMT